MPCALLAQQSGSINGAVTDESGGAIPNAQVMLTNAAQGTTLQSDLEQFRRIHFSRP